MQKEAKGTIQTKNQSHAKISIGGATDSTIPEVAWGDEGLEREERPGRVGTGMVELRFKSSSEGLVFPAYREGTIMYCIYIHW